MKLTLKTISETDNSWNASQYDHTSLCIFMSMLINCHCSGRYKILTTHHSMQQIFIVTLCYYSARKGRAITYKMVMKLSLGSFCMFHVSCLTINIWVRSWNCGCLVTWFCYQLIAKPGNKTAAVLRPDPYPNARTPDVRLFLRVDVYMRKLVHIWMINPSLLWINFCLKNMFCLQSILLQKYKQ